VYFGRVGFYITLFLFVLSLESMNIASLIEIAQTMDITILAVARITCGLEFFPTTGFICERTPGPEASPFGTAFVISMGFVVILLIAIPLGYYNSDDNIIVQKIAYSIFMLIAIEWFCFFSWRGFTLSNVPFFAYNQSQVLGTIIFNYAYVISIPSWVNEKKEGVSINKSLWGASILSTSLFIVIGIMGAWSYNFNNDGQDLLDVINSSALQHPDAFRIISRVTVYLFPIVTQLSGIPVFSIIIRYNLLENKICSKFWANIWAVIFPWVIAVPFYTGSGLATIIGWTSLLVNGFINFIIPLVLFIMSHRAYQQKRPMMGIRTAGPHRQTIMTGEINTSGKFSINGPHVSNEFVALPHRFRPDIVAVVFIVIISILVATSIVLTVLQTIQTYG